MCIAYWHYLVVQARISYGSLSTLSFVEAYKNANLGEKNLRKALHILPSPVRSPCRNALLAFLAVLAVT